MDSSYLFLGLLFVLAALAIWGLRVLRRREDRLQEDILKATLQAQVEGWEISAADLSEQLGLDLSVTKNSLAKLLKRGLISVAAPFVKLSPMGRETAGRLLRAHRMLERYYADRTGHDSAEWHHLADSREHELDDTDVETLSASLGHPAYDPHGDPIPDRLTDLPEVKYAPITELGSTGHLEVVHIEDEPAHTYQRIVQEGIYPGSRLQVRRQNADRIWLAVNGDPVTLPLAVARSIHAVPCPPTTAPPGVQTLSSLELGETGIVTELAPGARVAERRRLMDLGIIPGTRVTAELESPGGDPRGYRIREALIALRSDQARFIKVRLEGRRQPE